MSELTSTLTRKGQITVPARIRRKMGLKQGDIVAFEMVGDEVRLAPRQSVAERTAGALAKYAVRTLSAEELRAEAEQAIADEAVARSR